MKGFGLGAVLYFWMGWLSFSTIVLADEPEPPPPELDHVEFVYPTTPAANVEITRSAWNTPTGKALPYSVIAFYFKSVLPDSTKADFQNSATGLRVMKVESAGWVPLLHLHELPIANAEALAVASPHASFHWIQGRAAVNYGNTVLWYRPFGMEGGSQYQIRLPEGVLTSKDTFDQLNFATLPFEGKDVRMMHLIVPNYDHWKGVTSNGVTGVITDYVPLVVFDPGTIGDRPELRGTFHNAARFRRRGAQSSGYAKKSWNIRFDPSDPYLGFQEEDGSSHPRRQVVLYGGDGFKAIFTNWLSGKVSRYLERRYLAHAFRGATLSSHNYIGHVILNGLYQGAYLFQEDLTTGSDSWSTTDERVRAGFYERPILHQMESGGANFPDLGSTWSLKPESDLEMTLARGDGQTREWTNINIPFPLYQRTVIGTPKRKELDLEVKAQGAGSRVTMKLVPDPTVDLAQGTLPLLLQNPAFWEADPAGWGDVSSFADKNTQAVLNFMFPENVRAGKYVKLEYQSVYDFSLFHLVATRLQSRIFDWMDPIGVLVWAFFTKLVGATDNQGHNRFLFMNYPDLATMLEGVDFSEIDAALKAPPGERENLLTSILSRPEVKPRAKYFHIPWDCNLTFQAAEDRVPTYHLWQNLAKASPTLRQAYVDLFYPELGEGGVLNRSFYDQRLQEFYAELGNAELFEKARWDKDASIVRSILPSVIYPKIALTTNGDLNRFLKNYILSLQEDLYYPPSGGPFVRGDANANGVVDISDPIAILGKLYLGEEKPSLCLGASCDGNDDDDVDIADPIYLLNWLFMGGSPPPAPYPNPGFDLTRRGP